METPSVVVRAYVDGFNIYHAIADYVSLNPQFNYYKWLGLRALCEVFARPPQYVIDEVFYFTAYATWLSSPYRRHQIYISALAARGVTPVIGDFKRRDAECRKCGAKWVRHEEKQSDVALGVRLVEDAINGSFARALVVTGDSDLAPAIATARRYLPPGSVRVLIPPLPPGVKRTDELVRSAGGSKFCNVITWRQIEESQLDDRVFKGDVLCATRPPEYSRRVTTG